jgi:hypothetical protein
MPPTGENAPGLKRTAIMFNPNFSAVSTFVPSFETAGRSLKIEGFGPVPCRHRAASKTRQRAPVFYVAMNGHND